MIPSGVQPNLQTPAVESWSLKIEQQLSSTSVLGVSYIGSHGYHELLSLDANLPAPTICPASPCPAGYPDGAYYYPTGAALANKAVWNTTHWFSEGVSSYHGLEVDVNRHLGRGLQFRGVYTFSKSLDDGDNMNTSVATNSPAFVANPLQPKADYGRASFDVSHAGVINATYDLPFGRGDTAQEHPLGGAPDRKLATERNRDVAIRSALHARSYPTTHPMTVTPAIQFGRLGIRSSLVR